MVILDIANLIKNYMFKLEDAINICTMDKYFDNNMYITNLYDIDKNLLGKMTQVTIEKRRFKKVEKLYIYGNRKINNLNHLNKSLRVLNCGMDFDNSKIYGDMKFVKNLVKRDMYAFSRYYDKFLNKLDDMRDFFGSGIGQIGISELKLTELYCDRNINIQNLNHMRDTLKILSCTEICGINQKGISELKLKELICDNNTKINSVNHMHDTLNILKCRCDVDHKKIDGNILGQKGISQLKLREIYIGGNNKITDLNHMSENLKILDCREINYNDHHTMDIGLTQHGISKLKLEKLYFGRKMENFDISHMSDTLKNLEFYDSLDISKLYLSKLCIRYEYGHKKHVKINLNHMKDTLDELVIHDIRNISIDQESISELKLKYLKVEGKCDKIINLNHMKDTLEELVCNTKFLHKKDICELKLKKLKILYQKYGTYYPESPYIYIRKDILHEITQKYA